MANKTLFASATGKDKPTDTVNEAGGTAYKFGPKHALAQLAATGCFNGTYYSSSSDQLKQVTSLITEVNDNIFLAKLAVYSRERAFMKDMPAALVASLASRDSALMHRVFERCIDNGRVLRTLFQMIRSGQFGKKSLTSSLKRAFCRWLNEAHPGKLLSASIGNDPSLRDVLRMARPKPKNNERRAMFGWFTGNEQEKWAPASFKDLPDDIRRLSLYRSSDSQLEQCVLVAEMQSVRWDLLADAAVGKDAWTNIARRMGPQALRMNLNTLSRHGVLDNPKMVAWVADQIADGGNIERSRQFPYQFFAAYINANNTVPQTIRQALHTAAEIACGNIPELPGPVVIGLDTSGSMHSAVTGNRGRGATSKMRCVDVASLFAAAILRKNPDSVVIPFDTQPHRVEIDPGDTILSISKRLAAYGGGGTDCCLPLKAANTWYDTKKFCGCVMVSDNESWYRTDRQVSSFFRQRGTDMLVEWNMFKAHQKKLGNPDVKLACIDIQPCGSTQAPDRTDILNIGGFSDAVFNVVSAFMSGDATRFVAEVEATEI